MKIKASDSNVAAVAFRTAQYGIAAVMIAAVLSFENYFHLPVEALSFFHEKRLQSVGEKLQQDMSLRWDFWKLLDGKEKGGAKKVWPTSAILRSLFCDWNTRQLLRLKKRRRCHRC